MSNTLAGARVPLFPGAMRMVGGWGDDTPRTATALAWEMSWFTGKSCLYELSVPYGHYKSRFVVIVRRKDETTVWHSPDKNAGCDKPDSLVAILTHGSSLTDRQVLKSMGYSITKDDEMDGKLDVKKMFEEFEAAERVVEAARARRAPDANRKTLVMKAPLRYRYWEGGHNKRGERILFCVSNYCNVAGYFLIWREIYKRRRNARGNIHIERVRDPAHKWSATKSATTAVNLAQRRAAASRARLGSGAHQGSNED